MGIRPVAAAVLVVLLFSSVALFGQDDEWVDLKSRYEKTFQPVPIKQMFGDPYRELKISRRAPYTKAARDEIKKRRDQLGLKRAQILNERRKREAVVVAIGDFGGPRAAKHLMAAYEKQLGEIEKAKKNYDLYVEADRVDINPGVDPGGVYWDRWLGGERGAAGIVLRDEREIRDLILTQCARIGTPGILEWAARHSADHDEPVIREKMMTFLASTGEARDTAALERVFTAESAVWARVAILDHVAKAKSPGAETLVRAGLVDEAWPVRSAAVAALRALALRDRETIGALVTVMQTSDGRVRREIRDALSEATGEPFGLPGGEWKLWWESRGEDWTAVSGKSKPAPLPDPLPVVYGIPTASKRIAILIPRGSGMRSPTTRRKEDNDGNPSPMPGVDSALRIAVWELSQALGELPGDAEFIVIMYGAKVHPSSKKLMAVTKSNVKKALGVASKYPPEGRSNLSVAVKAAMGLGVKGRVEDLTRAGVGDVDTVFLVATDYPKWVSEYVRLRRVKFRSVNLSRLAPKK